MARRSFAAKFAAFASLVVAGLLIGITAPQAQRFPGTGFVQQNGKPGGQTIYGGTGAGDALTLKGSSNASGGPVIVDGTPFTTASALQIVNNAGGFGLDLTTTGTKSMAIRLNDSTPIVRAQWGLAGNPDDFITGSAPNDVAFTTVTGGAFLLFGRAAGPVLAIDSTKTNTSTSGTVKHLAVTGIFAPASGTAVYRPLSLAYTVNQTGGANGTVTGIMLQATETAVVGTHNLLDLQAGAGGTTAKFTVANSGTTTLADAANIVVGTSTGTKIGTATSQKIGFFNATPVVQQTGTTDLRTALINLGLYASGGASPLDLNGGNFNTTGTVGAGTTTITGARLKQAQGANVASANNLALGTDGNYFRITGTTTINCIDTTNWQGGSVIYLKFTGILTVTDSSAGCATTFKKINIGAALTTAANTTLVLVYDSTDTEFDEVGRSVN